MWEWTWKSSSAAALVSKLQFSLPKNYIIVVAEKLVLKLITHVSETWSKHESFHWMMFQGWWLPKGEWLRFKSCLLQRPKKGCSRSWWSASFPYHIPTKLQMQSNQQNEHFIFFPSSCIVELSGKAKKGHSLLTKFILYLVATWQISKNLPCSHFPLIFPGKDVQSSILYFETKAMAFWPFLAFTIHSKT